MKINSRYADDPRVVVDLNLVPIEFRHLIELAKEWSIGDDLELEWYIAQSPEMKRQHFIEQFSPHLDGLWDWHVKCEGLIPQPDELVLFDIAANAVGVVSAISKWKPK